MSITVVIADDHPVVRCGLTSLLEGAGVTVVGQASSGREAIALARRHKPHVVLLDIRMSDGDGLDALQRLRRDVPQTKVIMLSTYDNPTYIARARALGASDYLLKGSTRQQIVQTISGVAAGRSPARHGPLGRVAGIMGARDRLPQPAADLTQREAQVLRHLALGLSNKEIAQSLSISADTVKEHVQRLLPKINAVDRTQAAVWAVKNGFV
jgi:DNA-binding NarL/FixJ family response regulator